MGYFLCKINYVMLLNKLRNVVRKNEVLVRKNDVIIERLSRECLKLSGRTLNSIILTKNIFLLF